MHWSKFWAYVFSKTEPPSCSTFNGGEATITRDIIILYIRTGPLSGKLDETDSKILELLQQDGRMLFKDLARLARVSMPTVRYRIRKLLDRGIIRKFTVLVDSERIGRVKAIFSISGKSSDLEEIGKRLGQLEEVQEVCLTSGPLGVIVRAEVSSSKDLIELAKKISRIPEVGTSVLSIVTNTIKNEFIVKVPVGIDLG